MLSINGRFLTQRITGVQRYAHEMLHALDGLLEAHAGKNALEAELLVPPEVLEENPRRTGPDALSERLSPIRCRECWLPHRPFRSSAY